MNYFLVSDDYFHLIESADLNIITNSDSAILSKAMQSAIEEVAGYVRHRYNEKEIFKTFQIETDDDDVTATNGQRIYQSTSKKFYICTANATTQSLTDTSYFTEKDERNPKLVDVTIDVLLYHIHSRISPRNIPDLRRLRYDGDDPAQQGGAIGYLKQVQKGIITPNLPITDNGNQASHRVAWGKSDTSKYKI